MSLEEAINKRPSIFTD
jgi:serine/threonine protein kinase